MKGASLSFENHTFSTNEANHGKVEAHVPIASPPSPYIYIYLKGVSLSFENHTFSTNKANHGKVEAHVPAATPLHF